MKRLTIDHFYTYEVSKRVPGGMGYVLLLTLVENTRPPGLMDRILINSRELSDRFRLIGRATLAAKSVLDVQYMSQFARECNIWLEFAHPGIVPLLKVVDVDDTILALMPQYLGNLRDILVSNRMKPQDLLHALGSPVAGLADVYGKHRIVHQDLKPENILYELVDGKITFAVSDWGIANVQLGYLGKAPGALSQFALNTMSGWGTLPYMAPERFNAYESDFSADIFSLGMIFVEVVTGHLPYSDAQPLEHQILSGSYHGNAASLLAGLPPSFTRLVLRMISPRPADRPNYKTILKSLNAFQK